MSNGKGRWHEKRMIESYVQQVWPAADRDRKRGTADYGDVANVDPWLIEVKYRATRNDWRIPTWVRQIEGKITRRHGEYQPYWMLLVSEDKRPGDAVKRDLAIVDATMLFTMLKDSATD